MHISNQKRSFLYLGGKFSILPWLLPLLPESRHFIDVFGGSGVVMLNRKPSKIETYNDIDQNLYNFFKVLREQPEQLITQLELTLHSRFDYENAFWNKNESELQQARRFFIRTTQSIFAAGAHSNLKGWACSISDSRINMSERTSKFINSVAALPDLIHRFKHVQIECRDFRYVLNTYDHAEALFYCDSPYPKAQRSSTKYQFDFESNDHIDLCNLAKKVTGKIAISGYDSPGMRELYTGFRFHEGPKRKNGKSHFNHTECLWTNY